MSLPDDYDPSRGLLPSPKAMLLFGAVAVAGLVVAIVIVLCKLPLRSGLFLAD